MIYILGAIVLLGILVIMVKGSTTPGAGIDNETLQLKVAEVQQYGMELERAVTYIMRNGYSESDIRFAHPNHSSAYGDITDDPGRQVFAREGGGATWQDNDPRIQTVDTDWLFTGSNQVEQVGSTGGLGTPQSSELLAILANLNRDICLAINDKIGVTNPAGNPPNNQSSMRFAPGNGWEWTGSFGNHLMIGDGAPNYYIDGNSEACIIGRDGGGNTYVYFRVLLAR